MDPTAASLLLVVLVIGASYRLTHLVVRDHFPPVAWARWRIGTRFGESHWLSYLVNCMWCTSVWVSGAVTASVWLIEGGLLPFPYLVFLASSAVTGLLAEVPTGD
jgi:hypothetical protein